MRPMSLAYRLIEAHSPVKDAWHVLHPDSSIGAAIDAPERKRGKPIPTAKYNLSINGTTCDSPLNTWRWDKACQKRLARGETIDVDDTVTDPKAKRLDYIFFGQDPCKTNGSRWSVQSASVGMTSRHPTLGCSLSDHFSVEATLARDSLPRNTVSDAHHDPAAQEQATNDLVPAPTSPPKSLPFEIYDEILAMISSYNKRERRQRRLRLSHFVLQLAVSVGCVTAVWWSPRNYVSFILTLISTLGLGAGVIDGLIGGLFFSSEIRALKEFEWEIRNVKRLSSGSEGTDKSDTQQMDRLKE